MPPIIGRSTEGRDVRINVERLIVSRLLISATSGQGKSWTIRRLLEQTHGQIQQIVIDVEGEFFSLRERYDYVLAGGTDGDCPADVRCAAMLARKLLELRVSCIVDIYELTMKDRIHFVKLFLESMINAPKSLWHPCMVVIDESQLFAPQDAKCESTQAVVDLMTRGRKRGYTGVLCTLRPAALDANVRATALNKLIGGLSLDIDVERSGKDLGFSRNRWGELRALKPGHFFAIGPALCESVTEITVGPVVTTHPKAGQQAMAPPPPREAVKKVLASLADLPAEAEKELQTVEELKARVKTLEAEARKATPAADMLALKAQHAEVVRRYQTAAKRAVEMLANVPQAIEATREFIAPIAGEDAPAKEVPVGFFKGGQPEMVTPRPRVRAESNGHAKPDGEAKILRALAELDAIGVTAPPRLQVVFMSGYGHPGSTGFAKGIKTATEKGLIQIGHGTISITPEGRSTVDNIKPPKSSHELQQRVIDAVGGAGGKILRELIDEYPNAVDRSALVLRSGYGHPGSTGFAKAMGRLSAFGFIESKGGQVKATRLLFLEGR